MGVKVENFNQLNALKNVEENEVIFVNNENKYYKLSNGNWEEVTNEMPQMTLYDINKMIVAKLPKMTDDELLQSIKDINSLTTARTKFFALISNERRYYTLFNLWQEGNLKTLGEEVVECLKSLGQVKSIHLLENENAAECWVQDGDEDVFVLYLLDYTEGVIDCR